MSLAAIILTKDEERDLPGCLASLQGLADVVFVVDSGSVDRTTEIARSMGALVLEHPFVNQAKQMNWAIENVQTDAEWVLRIDADERIDEELSRSLRDLMSKVDLGVSGIVMARRTVFLGKRLRFGGTFPVQLLRVWRNGHGACEDRWMDEHIVLRGGSTVQSEGELVHLIPKSMAEWSRKHIWYAERECLDVESGGASVAEALEGQAAQKRKAKTAVYYRLPSVLRVFGYWVYRYFGQLGFLDGKAGFIYHFLQGFWYRLLVDVMLEERRNRNSAARVIQESPAGQPRGFGS
jgi:glycosyltransferase involved in cell wall biosynthesis